MGVRISETANIRLGDIRRMELTIHGKGHGKGKIVTKKIPTNLMMCIRDYIKTYRSNLLREDSDEDHLLLTETGKAMTRDTLKQHVRTISERSGIRFTFHALRRLYCTTLANDCDLRNDPDTLRRMMRHENIATTYRCYLNPDPKRMSEATEKLESVLTF